MDYVEFMTAIRNGGLRAVDRNFRRYIYLKSTGESIILMRRDKDMSGKKTLLCYIDMRFNKDGTVKDTYSIPIESVTADMLAQFIKLFKKIHQLGRPCEYEEEEIHPPKNRGGARGRTRHTVRQP